MSKVLVTESYLKDIANTIRSGGVNVSKKYTVKEMAPAISSLLTPDKYTVNIIQSDNQTITVEAHYPRTPVLSDKTASFSMEPITCNPDMATATIKANPGYKPGTLNQESFTFSDTNRTVTFSASPAIEVKSVTYKITNTPYLFHNVTNRDMGYGYGLYSELGINDGTQFYAMGDESIPSDFKTASNSVMQVIRNDSSATNLGYSGYNAICKNFYLISIPTTNDIYLYCYANYDNDTDLLANTQYQNPTMKIGTLTIDLSTFTRTFDKTHYLPPNAKQYACSVYHKQDADLMKQLNLVFCGNEAACFTYAEAYTHMYNWFVKLFEIVLASDSDSLTQVKTAFSKFEQYTAVPTEVLKDISNKNKFINNLYAALEGKVKINYALFFLFLENDEQYADNTQSTFLSELGKDMESSGKSVAYYILTIITAETKVSDTDTTTYTFLEALACYYQQVTVKPITATNLPIEIQYQYVDTFE